MLKSRSKNQMETFLMSNKGFVRFLLQSFQQERQKEIPKTYTKTITKFHQKCFKNLPDAYVQFYESLVQWLKILF